MTLFSFFFATIPGEQLDRCDAAASSASTTRTRPGQTAALRRGLCPALADLRLGRLAARRLPAQPRSSPIPTSSSTRTQTPGEPSVSLRDRDLRFAKLDRTRPASGRLHRRRPARREPHRHRSARRLAAMRGRDASLLLSEDRTAANCTDRAARQFHARAARTGAHDRRRPAERQARGSQARGRRARLFAAAGRRISRARASRRPTSPAASRPRARTS